MGKLSWLVLARQILEPILRQPVKKWNHKQSFKIFIFHLIRVDAKSFIVHNSGILHNSLPISLV